MGAKPGRLKSWKCQGFAEVMCVTRDFLLRRNVSQHNFYFIFGWYISKRGVKPGGIWFFAGWAFYNIDLISWPVKVNALSNAPRGEKLRYLTPTPDVMEYGELCGTCRAIGTGVGFVI